MSFSGGMKFTSHIETDRPDKVLAAMFKGIDFGAVVIKKAAQDEVPVDTGKLKKSIKIKKIKDGKSIGPDTDYDIYVEFGHHTKAGTFVPAQPYMRPALQQNRKEIAAFTAKEIRKVLK